MLAVGLVLVLAGLVGAAVGSARVARHQARVAADLAALAGAARVFDHPAAACGRAADLAAANGGRLAECTVEGLDLQVIVLVPVLVTEWWPGPTRTATATARAGPVRFTAD